MVYTQSHLIITIHNIQFKNWHLFFSAVVFQGLRCSACNNQLELPSVHFMCQHSYHQQLVNILISTFILRISHFFILYILIFHFHDKISINLNRLLFYLIKFSVIFIFILAASKLFQKAMMIVQLVLLTINK